MSNNEFRRGCAMFVRGGTVNQKRMSLLTDEILAMKISDHVFLLMERSPTDSKS